MKINLKHVRFHLVLKITGIAYHRHPSLYMSRTIHKSLWYWLLQYLLSIQMEWWIAYLPKSQRFLRKVFSFILSPYHYKSKYPQLLLYISTWYFQNSFKTTWNLCIQQSNWINASHLQKRSMLTFPEWPWQFWKVVFPCFHSIYSINSHWCLDFSIIFFNAYPCRKGHNSNYSLHG